MDSVSFRYNFRSEVDNDVLSGVAVDNVGMDVRLKLGDSRSNGFRDIGGTDLVSNERTRRSLPQRGAERLSGVSPKNGMEINSARSKILVRCTEPRSYTR